MQNGAKFLFKGVFPQKDKSLEENVSLCFENSCHTYGVQHTVWIQKGPYHALLDTALLDVSDFILNSMNEGRATADIFLDLKKASDAVNHELFIS